MKRTRLVVALAAFALGACVYDLDFYTQGSTGTGAAPVCKPGATETCYDGPAGTQGVGICKAGTKTCAAGGASWGPCAGEVLPQPADCASGMDKHCDGKVPACQGKVLWAKRFGGTTEQSPVGVAVDPAGSLVLAGYFFDSIDFGGAPLQSAGTRDVFVAKLDPDGAHVWSKRFGGAVEQFATGVAVDASGDVLVSGWFAGSIDFGGGPLISPGPSSGFVAKLGPDGSHLWSRSFGPQGSMSTSNVTGVAVEAAGGVVVTGVFGGTLDFGGGPISAGPLEDIFVAKLNPLGAHLWSKGFVCKGPENISSGVVVDGGGHVVFTGTIGGPIDFGGGPITGGGGGDVFVAKLDPSGNHLWSQAFGDSQTQNGQGIAVDPGSNLWLTGGFKGVIGFGGSPLSSPQSTEGFLARLDPSGSPLWARQFGDAAPADISVGQSVAVDPVGNTLVTGGFSGSAEFGGNPIAALGQDVFLAKLDPSGAQVWAARFGGMTAATGTGVAADASGNSLLTGYFSGSIDFGLGAALVSAGSRDVFVAKLSP